MKTTGIVRRVDDLGRIVIPKNVRMQQGITEGTPMELFIEDGAVIFKKYATYLECSHCGRGFDATDESGYRYCPYCGQRLSR